MNRRTLLVRVATLAAGATLPLQKLAASTIDLQQRIAADVARLTRGTATYVASKTGFAPVWTHGDALGWIEDAKGVAFAWVDRAQRLRWPNGDTTSLENLR